MLNESEFRAAKDRVLSERAPVARGGAFGWRAIGLGVVLDWPVGAAVVALAVVAAFAFTGDGPLVLKLAGLGCPSLLACDGLFVAAPFLALAGLAVLIVGGVTAFFSDLFGG